jgi:hypothetical protein
MNAEQFVLELKNLLPHGVYYTSNNFEKSINLDKKQYSLVQKNSLPTTGNIILDLINNYDCFYLRFGNFCFQKEVTNINGFQVFCGSSGTYLAFKDLDGKILEFDWDENSEFGPCAENSERFLKALLILFEFRSYWLMGIVKEDSEDVYLKKCYEAAGGIKYETFYRQLI